MVPRPDHQLISTVQAHLRQVLAVAAHSADEPTMRMISGNLRFLLVHENLARAWREAGLGGTITVKTWCIESVERGVDVIAFCGGGDILPGVPVSVCRGAHLKEKTLDLYAFCRATRAQVAQIKISTTELIDFVANAMGGSHFDPWGRAARKPKADILQKVESGEIPAPGLRFNDRSILHHEVLSIAQSLVRSKQVHQLLAYRVGERGEK